MMSVAALKMRAVSVAGCWARPGSRMLQNRQRSIKRVMCMAVDLVKGKGTGFLEFLQGDAWGGGGRLPC